MGIPQLSPDEITVARRHFERDGYVRLEGAVPAARLAALARDIRHAYQDERDRRSLFDGGGNLSGHLNCFPGEGSRFVWDALRTSGVADFVQSLAGQPLRMPNIGCNLNLPGSHPQNEHIDGYAATPFLIVNVAAVDTTLDNGAMEILPRTHRRAWQYWEVALLGPPRRRPLLLQGDAIVRLSTLWHRGMPNASLVPRPMLA
ncbi:MAG TPA: phytanoyl-CoA dioxygenase family protein, partial [Polyangiaceae bacterium]